MVYSPAWRRVQPLQTLVTPDGNKPAIEGWYENVRPLTEREKTLIREAAKAGDEAAQKQALGITNWIDNLSLDRQSVGQGIGFQYGFGHGGRRTIKKSSKTYIENSAKRE